MKKSTLFNCKEWEVSNGTCSISKRLTILIVMMVMIGSKALAGVSFEVIGGLRYLIDSDTKTATLMANTEAVYSGDIVVPESVKAKDGNVYKITAFGEKCFYGCTDLTSIKIPSSVTSLGQGCFQLCTKLTSITIPSSVTSLGDNCFSGCKRITSIKIPSSITSLSKGCFGECIGLTSIEISSSVTTLGVGCFWYCNSLTSIKIPSSVTSVGAACFSYCSELKNIELPSSITSLEQECFYGCYSLTSITIPSNVTSIGKECFRYCRSLTSIEIPSSVTSLGKYCFDGCRGLISVKIPSSVTSMELGCFSDCESLTSISIPSSITSVSGGCFMKCSSLTSIDIPSSVTSLGVNCFNGCSSLKTITLPSSITSMIGGCFGNCNKLESFYFKGGVPTTLSEALIPTTCIIYVPTEYLQDYKDALGADYKYVYTWNPNGSGDGDKPVTKCATPTVSYESGELKFACETAGAKYHYTISDKDMTTDAYCENGKVALSAAYEISVYATASGHTPSEKAQATLYWLNANLKDATNINMAKTRGVVASAHDGIVSVSGLDNGEVVKFYAADGKYIGQAVATDGTASYALSEALVIAKVGNNSIKIAMK